METTEVRRTVTRTRILEKQLLSGKDEKWGDRTQSVLPEDIKTMYLGKMAVTFINNSTRFGNMLRAYKADYPEIDEETFDRLESITHDFELKFASVKRQIEKEVSDHPLVEQFSQLRGMTGYQVAILMSLIKDISKFDTASNLMVYSGLASIHGMPVTKANINKIREYYDNEFGKEFKGFNTLLSGRMFVIIESMIKQKGWFFRYFQRIKKRIAERCLNNNETFVCTKEQAKKSKGKMTEGRHYMNGRKNYSLDAFTNNNAKRRVGRTFLHIFWYEWRKLRGFSTRVPYPVDYLGHNQFIQWDEIIAGDHKSD